MTVGLEAKKARMVRAWNAKGKKQCDYVQAFETGGEAVREIGKWLALLQHRAGNYPSDQRGGGCGEVRGGLFVLINLSPCALIILTGGWGVGFQSTLKAQRVLPEK